MLTDRIIAGGGSPGGGDGNAVDAVFGVGVVVVSAVALLVWRFAAGGEPEASVASGWLRPRTSPP